MVIRLFIFAVEAIALAAFLAAVLVGVIVLQSVLS